MRKNPMPFSPLGVNGKDIANLVEILHSNWVRQRNSAGLDVVDIRVAGPLCTSDLLEVPAKLADVEVRDRRTAPRRNRSARRNTYRILDAALRRGFDITGALLGLVLLSPFFAIVIAAIKLEGGPAFFSQPRIGKGLGKFRILKFRTMYTSASQASLLTGPEDPRVTRVGRFLRRYKVDELPQLVNVLKGEMQLVGVRPQVECFVDAFRREYSILLQDRPGITDPAALAYRNEATMFRPGELETQYISDILPTKLRISLKYFEARNLLSDVEILLRTILGSKGKIASSRQLLNLKTRVPADVSLNPPH
jgi:lipopolysaccharide/colanic/teichoic acid biosynthesis glycosyltransferase